MNQMIKKGINLLYKPLIHMTIGRFDSFYLQNNIEISTDIGHTNFLNLLSKIGNFPGMNILEIGSREVTGPSIAREMFSQANYTGFDIYEGPNVDIVGDAHKLSEYFDKKFDIIYSSAVFEHLAMPWIVATEIGKLLKIGGYVFVETHFSFSAHELPWHFFQYSNEGLKVLFNPILGFECIESGMSNPIVGRFSSLADDELKYRMVRNLYCHSQFLGKKVRDVNNFD